jgi:hypothetical protein
VVTSIIPAHTPIFSVYPVVARSKCQLTDARSFAS